MQALKRRRGCWTQVPGSSGQRRDQRSLVCASDTFTNPPSGKDYGAVELPDTISDFGKALEARLGKSILAVRPSTERFSLFNGIARPC